MPRYKYEDYVGLNIGMFKVLAIDYDRIGYQPGDLRYIVMCTECGDLTNQIARRLIIKEVVDCQECKSQVF